MLAVALTGNIASGKSTVAQRLSSHGARLIDADVLARQVVEPGTPALAEIAERWGSGVLDATGTLDRQALRRIVFSDPSELEALNAIVHPRVEALRSVLLDEARLAHERIVVSDIPLLFETAMEALFDLVVLVDAPRELRKARLIAARGLSGEEAQRMIDAQLPAEEKRPRADIVVENAGTHEELARQVDALWDELVRRAGPAH